MKKFYTLRSFITLLLIAIATLSYSQSTYIWTGASSSSWNDEANWSVDFGPNDGTIPNTNQSDYVIFDPAYGTGACTIDVSTTNGIKKIIDFTVNTGYTATITLNTALTLETTGNFVFNDGAFTASGTAVVTIGGNFDWSTSGTFTAGTGGVSVTGNFGLPSGTYTSASAPTGLSITGTMTLNGGTFNQNGSALTVTGAYIQSGGSYTNASSGNTATFNSTFTLSAGSFNKSGNGAVTHKGNVNISGTGSYLITSTGGNIIIDGANYNQTGGTYSCTTNTTTNLRTTTTASSISFTSSSGTFTHSAGTFGFVVTTSSPALSNTITINNTPIFNNVTFTNASTSTADLTVDVISNITINGTFTLSVGLSTSGIRKIFINTGIVNFKGTLFTTTAPAASTDGGGTGTIIFNGTSNVTIDQTGTTGNGILPLCNVEFNNTSGSARTYLINSGEFMTIGINGTGRTLTLSGTDDIILNTGTISAKGNITVTNTGTSGGGSATILLDGNNSPNLTGNGTAGQGKLPNVVFSKSSGTVTLASVISANGNWTNNNSGTGAIAGGSSTVVFCSGATQAINGSATSHNFNHLTVDKSANTLSIGGSVSTLNIGGDVTLSNGTFDAGSATLNLTAASSTWSQSSGFTFTNGTSTVDFQGATSNTFAGTATTLNFYNLTFAGALTAPSNTLKIRNNFTNNGTFTHNSGVVEFDGSGTQTVGGTANPTVFYDMKVSTNAHTVNMANNANLVNKIDVTDGGTFDADGTGNDKVFTLLSTKTLNGNTSTGGGTAQVGDLSAGTFSGNVVYQRYVDGFTQWRTIGCPISGSKTIADWDATIYTSGFTGADSDPDAFTSIYTYDATGQAYAPVGNETDIISADDGTLDGKGFLAYIGNTAPGTVMSPGITLTNTGAIISGTKTPAVKTGYNLLANPYPAPINFSNFETTNTAVLSADQYSVFDYYTGGFDVWDKSSGSSANGRQNGVIANGAAFFIRAGSNTTVTFNESHKDASPDGNFLKLAQNPFKKMRLTISSTTATPYTNSMLLAFSPISSDNYNNEDAKPMSQLAANSPTISSYSADGQKLVINKMGDLTKPYDILVRATVGVTGTYTIKADSLINEITGCVVLEDKLTGTQTDLKAGNSYTFSISDTTNAPRFVLHINGVSNAAFTASNTTVPTGGSINFTNTSTGATTYSWNFGDSNTSTVQNPSHVYTTTGTYTVTLTVTNGSCGSASTTQVITVESPLSISNSSSHNTMNVYNNGGNIVLNLNYDHVVKGTIEVFDVLGKNIHSQQFNGDRKQEIINLPNTVGTGIYLIRINSPDKTFTTRMFLSN